MKWGWKLTKVNGEDVFEFDEKSSLYFTIRGTKTIYLDNLMPTYPDISGVDFLQVVMTLCHVCKRELHMSDSSDLSTPYKILYEKNYYESTIYGVFKLHNNDKVKSFNQKTFLKCTQKSSETSKTHIYKKIHKNLEICKKQNQNLQHCPLGYLTVGEFLYKTIFPKCAMENIPLKYLLHSGSLTFQFVELNSLYKLMTKVPPPSLATSVIDPSIKNRPKMQNYETLESNLLEDKIEQNFEDAFTFCFTQVKIKEITAEVILKKVMRCVSENLDFRWKHKCE